MAELLFTETALLHIRAVLATQPIVDPVVSVIWWKGTVDNSRAPDGSTIWQTIENGHWYAFVSDWGVFPEPDERGQLLEQMHGFAVFRDQRVRAEPGVLHITLTDKVLAVEQSAA